MSWNVHVLRYGRTHSRAFHYLAGALLFLGCGACGLAVAATLCVNPSGRAGCKATIGAAVAAAAPGDTIVVMNGIYPEDVVIQKPLSLIAARGAQPVIEARGLSNGIFIDGMAAAPDPGVADVLVSGFTVRDANFEGILVANAYDVTLKDNHVVNNDRSLEIANSSCPGIPAFETNEGDDCGEGIHLMGSVHATVTHNDVEGNSGGILTSDETGTSRGNLITYNYVHDNPYDCGITMASHGPATSVIPSARASFGVVENIVAHNVSKHNGYQVPGAGAGVGIFAPFPGTKSAGNVVIDNALLDNGDPGVAMHNHAAAPAPAPPVDLNNNVIAGNYFSGNGADTADTATPGPTGINLQSMAPVYGTVISQNTFANEAVDVAFRAPSSEISVHLNNFNAKAIGIDNIGPGLVSATENWWGCPSGPGSGGSCASLAGTGVGASPWLLMPYVSGKGLPLPGGPNHR